MLLDDGIRVKVLDFGQALFLGQDRITSGAHDVGTLAYMAPEQLADPHEATKRSDVYSLGVVIVELVTGSPNRSRVSQLPNGLRAIASRCLEAEPSNRYEDGHALCAALRDLRKD